LHTLISLRMEALRASARTRPFQEAIRAPCSRIRPCITAGTSPRGIIVEPIASTSDTAARMKLIYIAGPYRGASEWQVVQNIRRAETLALAVWQSGAACICPHKNTALFGGAAEDSVWLEGDLEMMRRCDAVLCTDDWQRSVGAIEEVRVARAMGLPVFETIAQLQSWLAIEISNPDDKACPAQQLSP
jgi:hypothetical protein